jgi:hypothetical protein
MLRDGARAGVVRGQREIEVAVEGVEQRPQITGAAEDVLAGVEDVVDAEVAGGGGHELHHAARADGRNGVRVVRGLATRHRGDETRIDAVQARRFLNRGGDMRRHLRRSVRVVDRRAEGAGGEHTRAAQRHERLADVAEETPGGDRTAVVGDHDLAWLLEARSGNGGSGEAAQVIRGDGERRCERQRDRDHIPDFHEACTERGFPL